MSEVDFGPLTELIGKWEGEKGTDVAPEPGGEERTPYYEVITFSPVGIVTNAEKQNLAALHYHQIVFRKSNDEPFHNETGYWMWDAADDTVMHSLLIPRGVGVLAGGRFEGVQDDRGRTVLEVAAAQDDPRWGIVQSAFMRDNARTTEFRHRVAVGGGTLAYEETTIVDIYGRRFEHTDGNELKRVSD